MYSQNMLRSAINKLEWPKVSFLSLYQNKVDSYKKHIFFIFLMTSWNKKKLITDLTVFVFILQRIPAQWTIFLVPIVYTF